VFQATASIADGLGWEFGSRGRVQSGTYFGSCELRFRRSMLEILYLRSEFDFVNRKVAYPWYCI
jgi:hypothetical protein